MNELMSVDLLNNTHPFPCVYVFKVIGRVDNGFAARVVAAVRDELAHAVDPPFKTRMTRDGRHVAVTLEPTVETAEQVIAVYRRMRSLTGLVMLL
jgi:putative lipoic acid-binding regulatory protein